MTIFDMLGQSGVLSLLGMGTVFLFLVILIVAVTIMGKIAVALGWDKTTGTNAPPAPAPRSAPPAVKAGAVTAAITAAVTEYRETH